LQELQRHLAKGAIALFHAYDGACCRPQLLFGSSIRARQDGRRSQTRINRHSPDSGVFAAKDRVSDRLGQGQIVPAAATGTAAVNKAETQPTEPASAIVTRQGGDGPRRGGTGAGSGRAAPRARPERSEGDAQ